jgi:hypothetical protein
VYYPLGEYNNYPNSNLLSPFEYYQLYYSAPDHCGYIPLTLDFRKAPICSTNCSIVQGFDGNYYGYINNYDDEYGGGICNNCVDICNNILDSNINDPVGIYVFPPSEEQTYFVSDPNCPMNTPLQPTCTPAYFYPPGSLGELPGNVPYPNSSNTSGMLYYSLYGKPCDSSCTFTQGGEDGNLYNTTPDHSGCSMCVNGSSYVFPPNYVFTKKKSGVVESV